MTYRLFFLVMVLGLSVYAQMADLASALELQRQAEELAQDCHIQPAEKLMEQAVSIAASVAGAAQGSRQFEAATLKSALLAGQARLQAAKLSRQLTLASIRLSIRRGELDLAETQISEELAGCDLDVLPLREDVVSKRRAAQEFAMRAKGTRSVARRIQYLEKAHALDLDEGRIVADLQSARRERVVRQNAASESRKRFAKRLFVTGIVGAGLWFGGWEAYRQRQKLERER